MKKLFVNETPKKVGEGVVLYGWAETIRDHKKIIFIDLKDRSGIVQVVGDESLRNVSSGDVVKVEGVIKKRPPKLVNPHLATGEIEIEAKSTTVISKSNPLPIPTDTEGYDIDEETRLQYRYLDLRRPRMQKNLAKRAQTIAYIRNFLTKKDFIEVDTPLLTKTTPEGARDFVVPSRLQRGRFYALPQSPQQYKQLLMVAGLERYFQIARCFRDEDPRADRAYGEFTQLDLEMSFVTQEDILELTEELFTTLVAEIFPEKKIAASPWPRLTHEQAKEKYGSDRPDLRRDKTDKNELAFAWVLDFPLFAQQKEEDYFHGGGSAKFAPSHHMFTSPHHEDIPLLESHPKKVRGLQHDLVLNGYEIGGGSIRIHDPKVQEKVFELIGFTNEQKKQFEHLLRAFSYGVPPHGGIAPGIDRFLMVVLGETSIREVIPFPASSGGKTAVMDAPSTVDEKQLKELGIKVTKS